MRGSNFNWNRVSDRRSCRAKSTFTKLCLTSGNGKQMIVGGT